MSFDQLETSTEAGAPVRAYEFKIGENVGRYVTGGRDMLFGGNLWTALPISDDGVKLTGEVINDALVITAPSDRGPAMLFRNTPPSSALTVTVFNYHDGDFAQQVDYVGEVTQVNWPRPGVAEITCESLFAAMERDGLRLGWQRACPYALYDPRTCGVNKAAYVMNALILSAIDDKVQAAEFATKESGYFAGGFIEWDDITRGVERRAIEHHIGGEVRLFGTTEGLFRGLAVRAYPGCDRSLGSCVSRYNNLTNYGGCPDLDGTNPFDGNPVF